MKISEYTNFKSLNEKDNLSLFSTLRIWNDERKKKYEYFMPTRNGERIISYSENPLSIDAFMIGEIKEDKEKNIKWFNLEYIYSFKKWSGTKILLTYLNKHNIKDILYVTKGSFDFWNKMEKIFEEQGIKRWIPKWFFSN